MNSQGVDNQGDLPKTQTKGAIYSLAENTSPIKAARPEFSVKKQEFESIDFLSNIELTDSINESNFPYPPGGPKIDLLDITPQKIQADHINPKRLATTKSAKYKEKVQTSNEHQVQIKSGLLTAETSANTVPLYKIWPGKNRFYFNGRLMTGPKTDRITNTIAWILILGISLVYFLTAFPYLWNQVTIVLPLISIYLFVSTVGFLCLTSFTDPGIIPRKCVWEIDREVPYPFNGGHKGEILDINLLNNGSEIIENSKNKMSSKDNNLKFCKTCNIYRPPRSSHCSDCDNCVAVFDHHCPFVNNCIGKKNYRYFLGFLISLVLLGVCYLCGFIIMLISSIGSNSELGTNAIVENSTVTVIIMIILGIPTLISLIMVLTLCCFHCKLVSKGSTTKEQLKKIEISHADAKMNSVNWCRNDPSLFNLRQSVNQEQLIRFLGNSVKLKPA